jgi:hypothetical protein
MCCKKRRSRCLCALHLKQPENKGRLTGKVASCVGTAFYNTLLKETSEGGKDEEEDVSSYWTALQKR